MYNPTTRVLAVLELLQTHGTVSGADLAARLEVDTRSVRRYITILGDLGIPVEARPGRGGGYRLRPGYKLPPLMLTSDEAVAFAFAVMDLPHMGIAIAPAVVAGLQAKLERVLPVALRERVQAVAASVALDPPSPVEPAEGAAVALLGEAAQAGLRVRLRYRSRADAETDRTVEPYGIVRWSRAWYLVGYCHLRVGVRLFRLDRIVALEPLDETFAPRTDFDSYGYVVRAMAAYPGQWPVEVTLGLTMVEARSHISEAAGTLLPTDDGVLFRGRFDDLSQLARWLVTLGCAVTIHQPPELREELRRLAQAITAMADE